MNEVRARFLKSILEQLPAERIVELHFFAPIRQGQIETGVAVIAAEPERPLPVAEPLVESADTADEASDELEVAIAEDGDADADDVDHDVIAEVEESDDVIAEVEESDDVIAEVEEPDDDVITEDEADDSLAPSPYAEDAELAAQAQALADGELTAILDEHAPVSDANDARPRFEIITAAYRWTRKGPERGKWEVDVTTEAEAPFPTVGTVVKGVHDRAGEELEPMRLTAAELQTLLSEPQWLTPA